MPVRIGDDVGEQATQPGCKFRLGFAMKLRQIPHGQKAGFLHDVGLVDFRLHIATHRNACQETQVGQVVIDKLRYRLGITALRRLDGYLGSNISGRFMPYSYKEPNIGSDAIKSVGNEKNICCRLPRPVARSSSIGSRIPPPRSESLPESSHTPQGIYCRNCSRQSADGRTGNCSWRPRGN